MKHGLRVAFTEVIPGRTHVLAGVLQRDILNGQGRSAVVRDHVGPHGWRDLHTASVPCERRFWLGDRSALEAVQQ